MNENRRTRACDAVNAAVRDYARDPSQANAAAVEAAWRAFQKLDSISQWRQWKEERPAPVNRQPGIKGGPT